MISCQEQENKESLRELLAEMDLVLVSKKEKLKVRSGLFIGNAVVKVIILQETNREEIAKRVIESLWAVTFIDWVYLPLSGKDGGIIVA